MLLPQSKALPAAAGALGPSPLPTFLYTIVLGHCLSALLAFHGTTPVKLTITTGDHLCLSLLHSQTALPAQPLTTPLLPFAQVLALLQTLPALCAR